VHWRDSNRIMLYCFEADRLCVSKYYSIHSCSFFYTGGHHEQFLAELYFVRMKKLLRLTRVSLGGEIIPAFAAKRFTLA
jgi:hypothetical protein